MKPGRELDALVAEKVMGWEWKNWSKEAAMEIQNPFLLRRTLCPPKCSWAITYVIPKFSTDISAAWEIVETLRSDNWVVMIIGSYVRFFYKFVPNDFNINESYELRPITDSLPYAITLAALKVLGVRYDSSQKDSG